MREFGIVSPRFWIGETGKKLRGNPQLQVLALYLLTSPHSNLIGVYHVPVMYIGHETGLGLEGASKGLASLSEAGFCTYCEDTETVWVHEFARYQIGEELKENDNRCKSIQRHFSAIQNDEIKDAFFVRYGDVFHLQHNDFKTPLQAPSKGLQEGLQKPPLSLSYPSLVNDDEKKAKRASSKTELLPEGFVEFWDAYPRKIGKADAAKAWKAAKINGRLPDILAAIKTHCQSEQWQKGGGQYIPYPATWIRQERWHDVVTTTPSISDWTQDPIFAGGI